MPTSWFREEKMHKNFIRDVYAMNFYNLQKICILHEYVFKMLKQPGSMKFEGFVLLNFQRFFFPKSLVHQNQIFCRASKERVWGCLSLYKYSWSNDQDRMPCRIFENLVHVMYELASQLLKCSIIVFSSVYLH